MKRPKHLTEDEARTLTRREILDRVEAEQEWFNTHKPRTEAQHAEARELGRILFAYLSPSDGIDAAMDHLNGIRNDYWDTRPGETS